MVTLACPGTVEGQIVVVPMLVAVVVTTAVANIGVKV